MANSANLDNQRDNYCDNHRIAEALRKRRLELELSQRDLAEQLQASKTFVDNVEKGAKSAPELTFRMFVRLLKVLQWSLADFEQATGTKLHAEHLCRGHP